MLSACDVCFHHCKLKEGQVGLCYARKGFGGNEGTAPVNYGHITSIALDPIEKKPLYHFHPGSQIVSVGSYGCNLKCPFCQNVGISLADDHVDHGIVLSQLDNDMDVENVADYSWKESIPEYEYISPEELVGIAEKYVPYGNIGAAFTYNEPLVCYEYVRDTARLLKEAGLCSVVVTNGSVNPWVVDEIGPYVDAMNVDLKSFSDSYYKDVLKGDLNVTKEFIRTALKYCHVEITTLVVTDDNDSEKEMKNISAWISDREVEFKKKIPFHISRFFPRSRYANRKPTDLRVMQSLYDVAKEKLQYVYLGNC